VRNHERRPVAQALMGLLVVASACTSATKRIDTAKLERNIHRAFAREANGFRVGRVDCPQHVERGDTFRCDAAIDGEHRTYRAHAPEHGKVSFVPLDAVIVTARATESVAQKVAERSGGIQVSADCGSRRVIVRKPGETFTCTATAPAGGQRLVLTLQVKDVNGTFEITSA
jgi:hypothetical protein